MCLVVDVLVARGCARRKGSLSEFRERVWSL